MGRQVVIYSDELYHHGIRGQKWGIRRYQNPDGTLTAEGKKRYGVNTVDEWKDRKREMNRRSEELRSKAKARYNLEELEKNKDMEDLYNESVVRRNAEFWYEEGSSRPHSENANYYAQRDYERAKSTKHNDAYKAAKEKADRYVQSKMKKEFGQSYDTWKNENETKAYAAAGALMIGTLGFLTVSAIASGIRARRINRI